MKRLAAIAVVVAMSALPACAQHGGGSHGGFSGSHSGGFSAPHAGFSGGHGGFSAPSFHTGSGTFVRGGPPRFAGGPSGTRSFYPLPSARPPFRYGGPLQSPGGHPWHSVSNSVTYPGRMPYPGRGLRPAAPTSSVSRGLNPGTSHRMPYHSPYGSDRGDHAWNHGGGGHDGGGVHHHVVVVTVNRWAGFPYVWGWPGYSFWPWWGWGWNYPILPASWDFRNNDDPAPGSSNPASQYPEYLPGPYNTDPSDQPEPQQPESTPLPDWVPSPSAGPGSIGAPITLVFKDGRPNEKIHNYMLTATTLSVLDQQRRDIPVDEIDLEATARMNRDAGVEFAPPIRH